MKVKELRLMSELDLESKTAELKKELMKINTQVATRTVSKNPTKAREIKKTIAKIMTLKQKSILQKMEAAKTNG